jgi:hypothetical protein
VRAGPAILVALLGAVAGGCGPYPELGQKLDVGVTIADGEGWIAASGTEVRVLVLGRPDPGGGPVPFAFTAMSFPITAGTAAWSAQGTWTGTGSSPSLALRERLLYRMADERGTALLERHGSTRTDVDRTITLGQSRAAGQLLLNGDASIAGTYLLLSEALAHLGTTSADDAACAFQVANLAVLSSQVRILGFGGALMAQYKTAASFLGTASGHVEVDVSGFTSTTTDITYSGFSDFAGVTIDGTQTTHVNSGGDGSMSGTVTFTFAPPAPAPPVDGAISYGTDAIQISGGSPTGGNYLVTLAGGGTAQLSPVGVASPSVAECLALPPP